MLDDYKTLVLDLMQDDAGRIAPEQLGRAITAAMDQYSLDRPRKLVEDLTPADANTLPLPEDWEADFSALLSLEYPMGDLPPTLIAADRFQLYQEPESTVIKLVDAVNTAEDVRATYSVAHVLDDTVDSVRVQDRKPIAAFAAAELCDQLATLYAGETDSTIGADSVKTQTRSQAYASRAKTLRQRYTDALGVPETRNVAAGTVVTLNPKDSLGQTRLTHSRGILRGA